MSGPLGYLFEELEKLAQLGLLRQRTERCVEAGVVDACSNDYLGYGSRRATVLGESGATGSRLVVGDGPAVRELERDAADWVGMGACLVFSSGYAANVGVISAVAGVDDLVVSDERNHASIIDGCRLSRATVRVVPHLDRGAVAAALDRGGEFRRRWVVTESYFSMDGTVPDLRELRTMCDSRGAALIVDEAHALGVFGAGGAGRCKEAGVVPDVLVGTFGKAVGAQGAFVAGSEPLILWLWNRARSFVFSTGLSPILGEVVRRNLRAVREDEGGRQGLWLHVGRFREALETAGIQALRGSVGPIIPVVVGDSSLALEYERRLNVRGFLVKAIRPPTVADGSARLRVTLRATMSPQDVASLAGCLAECRPW